MSEVEELRRRLEVQGKAFCEANDREVQKTNALRVKHEATLRDVTEASEILTQAMLGRDPTRRELVQVLERLQRVMKR